MEITLAIIGTAGRKDDIKKLTRHHFEAMCLVAELMIEQTAENNYPITHLVSGGAAWADHVAVRLFLDKKVPNLRLYIPAEWENGKFYDTGVKDAIKNPGGTANYFHKLFQQNTGVNGLSDIQLAQAQGAELLCCRGGFHGRNSMVAKSDFMLACTFGDKHMVKEGGTADTLRKYLGRVRKEGFFDKSFHYDLTTKEVYEGCQVPAVVDAEQSKKEAQKLARKLPFQLPGVFAMHSYPP